jgi:hypothetical protein
MRRVPCGGVVYGSYRVAVPLETVVETLVFLWRFMETNTASLGQPFMQSKRREREKERERERGERQLSREERKRLLLLLPFLSLPLIFVLSL